MFSRTPHGATVEQVNPVEISEGRVEGVRRDGHLAFLGIPYARPPVGARRFAAPEPPEPWSGVRRAAAFGPSALQGASIPDALAEGPTSEDCLYLNVYTPGSDGARRPVLVWIHGGAFIAGSAASPVYDGGRLAEAGDVVVVTFNYRLGAFGYLHLGDRGRTWGAADNAGLLDQLAALRWVQRNIAAFGGDPSTVTVFGESAGATSVCLLLVAPAARGLFARAISQSGAATLRLPTREDGDRTVRLLLDELGLAPDRAEALRNLPGEAIRKAQIAVERRSPSWPGFFPIRAETSLPAEPGEVLAHPDPDRPPLLIGANRDEFNLFAAGSVATWSQPLSDEEAVQSLKRLLPRHSGAALERFLGAYRASRQSLGLRHDNRALLRAIQGDYRFRMASLWWADAYQVHQPATYAYLFSYESPALRGALGACHALELPFVFGTLDAPKQDRFAGSGPEAASLSRLMMTEWLAFARRGDPNPEGESTWPRFDLHRRATRIFDRVPGVAEAPFDAERRAWGDLLVLRDP
jgi:para-nitrobenzyl esterase